MPKITGRDMLDLRRVVRFYEGPAEIELTVEGDGIVMVLRGGWYGPAPRRHTIGWCDEGAGPEIVYIPE